MIGPVDFRTAPLRWAVSGRIQIYILSTIWAAGVLSPLFISAVVSVLHTRGLTVKWQPTLDAYRNIVGTGRWEVVLRTVTAAAVVTLICLLIGFPFALWLARHAKSKSLTRLIWMCLTVPFFLDPSARTLVWRSVLGSSGLINALLLKLHLVSAPVEWLLFSDFSIYLGFIGPYFPNMVMPVYLAVTLIGDDLINASADLGASHWATLRHVIIPLAMPGIVAGAIFTFVPVMGDTVVPDVLGGGNKEFLGDAVMSLSTTMNYSGAAAFAMIVLAMTALLITLFAVFARRLAAAGSSEPRGAAP